MGSTAAEEENNEETAKDTESTRGAIGGEGGGGIARVAANDDSDAVDASEARNWDVGPWLAGGDEGKGWLGKGGCVSREEDDSAGEVGTCVIVCS